MKIGSLDSKAVGAPAGNERKTAPAPAAGTPAGTAAEPSAKVKLSSTASSIAADGDGDFDTEKVERIAQAIRDGKFKVNHEAIADKLISNAQELLGGAAQK